MSQPTSGRATPQAAAQQPPQQKIDKRPALAGAKTTQRCVLYYIPSLCSWQHSLSSASNCALVKGIYIDNGEGSWQQSCTLKISRYGERSKGASCTSSKHYQNIVDIMARMRSFADSSAFSLPFPRSFWPYCYLCTGSPCSRAFVNSSAPQSIQTINRKGVAKAQAKFEPTGARAPVTPFSCLRISVLTGLLLHLMY